MTEHKMGERRRGRVGLAIGALLATAPMLGCDSDNGAPDGMEAAGGKADAPQSEGDCDKLKDEAAQRACLTFANLSDLDGFARKELWAEAEPLPRGPDGEGFDFCTGAGPGLHLQNAAWLAFMSANAYVHPDTIGPVLSSLGFGNDSDLFWGLCYADVFTLQALEEQWANDPSSKPDVFEDALGGGLRESLSVCGRDWYLQEARAGRLENKVPAAGLAAKLESWLLQEVDADSKLQFFSGGEFNAEDERPEFRPGSTQALWAEHRQSPAVIISFRGTEPSAIADILVDLDVRIDRLVDFPHWFDIGWGNVHRGFNRAAQATAGTLLLDKVDQLEATEDGTPHEIWVTGHSLGGALATLFASALLEKMDRGEHLDEFGDPRWVVGGSYTFGSPRVGRPEFGDRFEGLADRYGASIMRFRNHDDLVTRVPFWLGLEHVGQLEYLDDDLELHHAPDDIDEPWVGSVADHAVADYYHGALNAMERPDNASFTTCE